MNQDTSGLATGSCVPHLCLVLPFAVTNTRRDGHRLGPCRSVRRPEDVCVDTGHEIVVRYDTAARSLLRLLLWDRRDPWKPFGAKRRTGTEMQGKV